MVQIWRDAFYEPRDRRRSVHVPIQYSIMVPTRILGDLGSSGRAGGKHLERKGLWFVVREPRGFRAQQHGTENADGKLHSIDEKSLRGYSEQLPW